MALVLNGSGITSANLVNGTIVDEDVADVAASKLTGALPAIDGSALTGVGKVLQVVMGTKTDRATASTGQGVLTDIVNASITPSSTSSKILVQVMLTVTTYNSSDGAFAGIKRGSTVITQGSAPETRTACATGGGNSGTAYNVNTISMSYLDSPSTTSATTYYGSANKRNGGTLYINRAYDDTDGVSRASAICTIILMEIGA